MFNVNEAIDDIINDLNDDYYESVYDEIFEELCYRVEEGELSLEDAEIINEAAYDRYVTEAVSRNFKDIKKYFKESIKEVEKCYNDAKNLYKKNEDDAALGACKDGLKLIKTIRKKIQSMPYTKKDAIIDNGLDTAKYTAAHTATGIANAGVLGATSGYLLGYMTDADTEQLKKDTVTGAKSGVKNGTKHIPTMAATGLTYGAAYKGIRHLTTNTSKLGIQKYEVEAKARPLMLLNKWEKKFNSLMNTIKR